MAADKLMSMSHYAHTVTMCRHAQIMAYFGVPSSELVPCRTMCDSCIGMPLQDEHDVTEVAHDFVRMFESQPLRKSGARGITTIVNTIRGSTRKDVLPCAAALGHFGAASNTSQDKVEAVLSVLLAHDVLRGVPSSKQGGPLNDWSQSLKFQVNSCLLFTVLPSNIGAYVDSSCLAW